LDTSRPINEINLEFENANTDEWEHVMPRNDDEKKGEDFDDGGEDDKDAEDDGNYNKEEILDMPPPWSPKLIIDK
jgi:hypothetical protein